MGIASKCTNGYWAIDGEPIYVPSGVEISHENIVTSDSGRVESGYMHVTFVRGDVRTVQLEFDHITGYEVAFMRELTQGRVFELTFYDNGIQVMQGYVGRTSYEQKNLGVYTDEGGEYENYKFNVIEI